MKRSRGRSSRSGRDLGKDGEPMTIKEKNLEKIYRDSIDQEKKPYSPTCKTRCCRVWAFIFLLIITGIVPVAYVLIEKNEVNYTIPTSESVVFNLNSCAIFMRTQSTTSSVLWEVNSFGTITSTKSGTVNTVTVTNTNGQIEACRIYLYAATTT